ncbi:41889_t:CDS:2, partial [Gigaspora margarita]
ELLYEQLFLALVSLPGNRLKKVLIAMDEKMDLDQLKGSEIWIMKLEILLLPYTKCSTNECFRLLGLIRTWGARILSQSSTTSTSTSTDQYVAYNKNRFEASLNPSKDSNNSNILNIEGTFHNVSVDVTVQNLLFQAAIPKTQKLQMQPSSSTGILPSAIAQQTICVTNPQK